MKAIVLSRYGSPDFLQLQDIDKPIPQENEVLIKVEAASINDWDWCMVRGSPFYMRLFCGLFRPKIGIPGVDAAGVVEAVGENVSKFKPGDEVYGDLSESGFGAFAEFTCAPEMALVSKPSSMSSVEAAAIPHAAALVLQGLRDEGQIRPGQSLLINGAGGGVGTLGVQIAKSIGVREIAGVDHGKKFEAMNLAGYETLVDYTQEDFTKSGIRYDLILDTKTDRSVFRYLRALKPNGSYVTVGGHTSRLLQAFLFGPVISRLTKKRIRLVALKPNKDLDDVNALYEAGQIKPVIDGPYSLSQVPEAIQYFGSGKHKGKIVITIDKV